MIDLEEASPKRWPKSFFNPNQYDVNKVEKYILLPENPPKNYYQPKDYNPDAQIPEPVRVINSWTLNDRVNINKFQNSNVSKERFKMTVWFIKRQILLFEVENSDLDDRERFLKSIPLIAKLGYLLSEVADL